MRIETIVITSLYFTEMCMKILSESNMILYFFTENVASLSKLNNGNPIDTICTTLKFIVLRNGIDIL